MRIIRLFALAIPFLILAYFALWGTLALWYRLPEPEGLRLTAAALFAALGLFTLYRFTTPLRWRAAAVFTIFVAAIGIWWQTITPPQTANWSPQVAHQTTGTIDGDILTLTNIRDFTWRSEDDYDENWITRDYDLSKLETADLILSYWGSPYMAHMIVSFGFADGEYLAWSVEVRRLQGGSFSPLADFFKAHTISYIGSLETDVIGVRSNIRGENVYIYRLDMTAAEVRNLFDLYIAGADRQLDHPQWFNSVFSNCSTTILKLLEANGVTIPVDYRLLANGYLANFAYERGLLTQDIPFEELRQRGLIDARAKAHGLTGGFSQAIREGVPVPPDQR